MSTKIETGKYWTKSLNPLKVKGGGYHCTKTSPGCANCWAEGYNNRFGNRIPYDNARVEFELDRAALEKPLSWRKPQVVFVCDLCDLFHEDVPFGLVDDVFSVMSCCLQHEFLVLTKRPERMAEFFNKSKCVVGPLPNVMLGVTAENQEMADLRVPILLSIPAARRFVSHEPALGPVDWDKYLIDCSTCGNFGSEAIFGNNSAKQGGGLCSHVCIKGGQSPKLDLVIFGCESGPNRRECDIKWVRGGVKQCRNAGVPAFVKQLSINGKVSRNMNEWPEDLRVRQWPVATGKDE